MTAQELVDVLLASTSRTFAKNERMGELIRQLRSLGVDDRPRAGASTKRIEWLKRRLEELRQRQDQPPVEEQARDPKHDEDCEHDAGNVSD